MRTTIRLDDELLAEVKKYAASNHLSFTSVIEDSLRQFFAHRKATAKRRPPALPVFRGSKLQSGVDLDDSAALLELMDKHDS